MILEWYAIKCFVEGFLICALGFKLWQRFNSPKCYDVSFKVIPSNGNKVGPDASDSFKKLDVSHLSDQRKVSERLPIVYLIKIP